MDDFSINGAVKIPVGSTLIVNGELNVGGGASIDIQGTLITKTYTQVGNTYLQNGKLVVSGKYTIGGGTTLYTETSKIEANELVIIGHIQSIENNSTKTGKYYSVIELTGSKYLNRGGGTTVCGPILFTSNNDQGASGQNLSDKTSEAKNNNPNIYSQFSLIANSSLFQYEGNCTPLSAIPAH